jgi:hypothetical protein
MSENIWIERINLLLSRAVEGSFKRDFCLSVGKQIEASPLCYPTKPQLKLLERFWRSYLDKSKSEVEKQVAGDMGL